jgi:hypothetical protein
MSLEDVLEKMVLQQKRIADRLEMIHNHLSKLPESNKNLDTELEEQETEDEAKLEQEEKPKRGRKAKTEPIEDKKLTEEDVRIAANAMVKACIKSSGGDRDAKKKEAAVKEGKKEVKRVLSEFDAELIEDLTEDNYALAIRAFDRVAGTFAPDAETSDDLDI